MSDSETDEFVRVNSIEYEDELNESVQKAAGLIDKGKFDEFENMHKIFDLSDEETRCVLVDEVQTLSGIKYLEQKGLIPNNYFTDRDRAGEPVFYFASPEQIDFYVEHGADVNAKASHVNATTLDYAVMKEKPETVEKLISVGCVSARGKKFGFRIENLNDAETQTVLKNVAVLLKHDFKPEKGWFAEISQDKNKDLFKKYPDLMSEIMSYDNRTNIQKAKDRIRDKNKQKEQRKENLEQVKSMTRDIKLGMEITRGKDYGRVTEQDRQRISRGDNGILTSKGLIKFTKDGMEK